MRLNTIKPARGASARVCAWAGAPPPARARPAGAASKGQRARKGGYHKVGFEGGQMPLAAPAAEDGFPLGDQADARRSAAERP